MSTKNQPEIILAEGQINEVIIVITPRPNGRSRIQQDFQFCPTMTEQHSAHLTDLNYLIKKYKPDELAAYIQARNMQRREILGVDFSREPSLMDAKNEVYRLKQAFQDLPEDIKQNFQNHVEFIKFIDNPANAEKMLKLGILTKKQIEDNSMTQPTPTPTQEKENAKAE